MSYSISISGHGASADKVKDAFGTALKSLAAANAENGGGDPSGTASGSDNAGQPFSFSSTEILSPAEQAEEDEE
jgi:hypothetical protein